MIIKTILDEDFTNYKEPSMLIGFPKCTFKCDKEYSQQVCQNCLLSKSPNIEISIDSIIKRYMNNKLTSSIVCGGLEPFDSWDDLYQLVAYLRVSTEDDIVIYTGYYKEEIQDEIKKLTQFKNIIIKFGRYIPNQEKHYDEELGVYLASNNQYAERIS